MMSNNILTKEDLLKMKTNQNTAIELIKKYSSLYESKAHYEQLGSNCVMSVVNTINTIMGSAKYLDGEFLMPDEIHIEKLTDWFVKNKKYDCDRNILTYFMADYLKRKINKLYRSINRKDGIEISSTFTLLGNNKAYKRYIKEIKNRKKSGVKIIR